MLDRYRSRNRPRRTGSRPLGGGRPRDAQRPSPTSPTSSATAQSSLPSTSPTRTRSPRRSRPPTTAFGGIDVLVNNAGNGYLSAIEEGEDDEVRKLFDTNYFGVVDTIKAVLPAMRARRSGHIINISSMTGLVANPPNAYYSSTKFALEALTEALAQEVEAARHQGDRDRARRVPHRLGCAVDVGILHSDQRLRRERRCPQDDDQGVRQPPARRPAQGRRGRAHGDHAATNPHCGSCSAATC